MQLHNPTNASSVPCSRKATGRIDMPFLSCSKCHSQGGARLLLLVIVAVFLVAVVLMFARDWGSPAADTSGSGWTVKLKIVITHLQVCAVPWVPSGITPVTYPASLLVARAAMKT
jgi:hypothetical protein